MIKELIYKWFGLSCRSCEILERELDRVNREKEILLNRLLEPKEVISAPVITEETPKPISLGRRHIPAIVRQQMMEQNDRRTLELMQKHKKELTESKNIEVTKEVEELEKELGVEDASKVG